MRNLVIIAALLAALPLAAQQPPPPPPTQKPAQPALEKPEEAPAAPVAKTARPAVRKVAPSETEGNVIEEIVARVNNQIITRSELEHSKATAQEDAQQECQNR